MSEWNYCPEVIARAQELPIGTRVAIHWVEAEAHDQEGTVVGIGIERYGRVNYSVHIDGDISPTDEFRLDHTGRDACSIRPIDPNTAPTAMQPDGLLSADMHASELRLHMGEMTAQEVRTARAAIGWANSEAAAHITRLELQIGALMRDCEVYKGHATDQLERALKAEADVARLTKERDEQAEISANSRGVHIDRNRWKDRAETAEAQNKAMMEAL